MTAYRRRNQDDRVMLVDQAILQAKRICRAVYNLAFLGLQYNYWLIQLMFTSCFAGVILMLKCFCCCFLFSKRFMATEMSEDEKGKFYRLREKTRVPFDSTNREHKESLALLYRYAFSEDAENLPNTMLSENWMDMGFQSNDPSRDFRGGGLTSLHHLLYYAENSHENFIRMVNLSQASLYMLALTSIRLTFFMREYFLFDSGISVLDPLSMDTMLRRRMRNLCIFIARIGRSNEAGLCLEPRMESYARLHKILLDLHFAAWSQSTWNCDHEKLRSAEHAAKSIFKKVIESKIFLDIYDFEEQCRNFELSWLTQDDLNEKNH